MGQPSDGISAGPWSILIVEDEFFIALDLKATLTEAGFQVLGPTSTVHTALEAINEQLPHAAVLDVNLGRERVTPVAMLLKELHVPFVLTTASAAHELALDPALAGAENLGKPTNLVKLVKALRELLA